MTSTPDPWSFFDKIYCISIDTRIDRRTEAKKQFAAAGLLQRVEFVLVSKHPTDRERGIYQSHLSCLKKGLQAGAEHILIFEDDVLLKNFPPQRLLDATAFLRNSPDWQGFFLGAITGKVDKTAEPAVSAIRYRCLAHAYALNRPFAEHISKLPWQNIPFDELLRREGRKFYALSPMIAFQGGASSDNQTVALDRIRRIFGGLPHIQRANELFQKHKLLIVSAHLILLLVLLLLILRN